MLLTHEGVRTTVVPALSPVRRRRDQVGLRREERVVGWKAKWITGSREALATESRIVADLDPALHAELARDHAAIVTEPSP